MLHESFFREPLHLIPRVGKSGLPVPLGVDLHEQPVRDDVLLAIRKFARLFECLLQELGHPLISLFIIPAPPAPGPPPPPPAAAGAPARLRRSQDRRSAPGRRRS